MNERIRELYDQAIIIEDGGDYVCGELDPEKFAELIVWECVREFVRKQPVSVNVSNRARHVFKHFGVEE